jgi:hypothetical protein
MAEKQYTSDEVNDNGEYIRIGGTPMTTSLTPPADDEIECGNCGANNR